MAEVIAARTRAFDLSESDWGEIYYALDDETGAKTKIDEFGPSGPELTNVDWLEIFLAVRKKRAKLKDRFYGDDRLTRKWIADLDGILEELVEIGAEYIGS